MRNTTACLVLKRKPNPTSLSSFLRLKSPSRWNTLPASANRAASIRVKTSQRYSALIKKDVVVVETIAPITAKVRSAAQSGLHVKRDCVAGDRDS